MITISMNSADYIIIVGVIIVVIAIAVLALLVLRKRTREDEYAAEGAEFPRGTEKPSAPTIEIPGSNPMRELTKLPRVAAYSNLPEEATNMLMNAVWYRCENPKCNFTQFL